MEQRTEEWFAARAGKVTATRLVDVLATVKAGEPAARANYRAELVAQRLTGRAEEGFASAAMRWGVEQEPAARAAYEAERGVLVQEVGLIDHPTIPNSAASPDGLVGEDGLIEIKCPETKAHIATLIAGREPRMYIPQMQWQMACTGRKWCDFVSFDPRMPEHLQLFVTRVYRDDKLIADYEATVREFLEQVDDTVAALRELGQAGLSASRQ